MDKKIARLFGSWQSHLQSMNELYGRLDALLADLGMTGGKVRVISFASSAWRREIRFYDSASAAQSSPRWIEASDDRLARQHLIELFGLKPERSIFNFNSRAIQHQAYDEFGLIPQARDEVYYYGVVVEYPALESSRIVQELLAQIAALCRSVLDDEKLEIEDYMLPNLVHTALKKQIDIDFYNTLAASPYEKRVTFGGILLLGEGVSEEQCDFKIKFEERYPLDIKNVRQIRKLLEMTADKFYLISRGGYVVGIGDCAADCDLFQFNGHQLWSYRKNGRDLLTYKEGKYAFISSGNKDFISDFPPGFVPASNAEYLNDILHEIRQQKRGTLLIISDDAPAEVERLCNTLKRGYAIEPVDLKSPKNRNLLSNITSIDGALFIDTDFLCHGVGVILDGIAVKVGLSSRGARYNSAKCYIDNKPSEKYVAVVVSEDETIDIIYNKDAREGEVEANRRR